MSYVEGAPLEQLFQAPQAERDRIMTLLIGLVARELFEFGWMQTDPNFANYRYQEATGKIALLDFGATRGFAPELAQHYRALLRAALAGDRAAIRRAAIEIGLFGEHNQPRHQEAALRLIALALAPLGHDGTFDFGRSDLAARLRDGGLAIAADRDFVHAPPIDTMFLQRKVGGMFLLATRLKARVNVKRLLQPYLR
jgi:hypothetical protein